MIPTKALRSADLELQTTVGAAPYGGLDGEQPWGGSAVGTHLPGMSWNNFEISSCVCGKHQR